MAAGVTGSIVTRFTIVTPICTAISGALRPSLGVTVACAALTETGRPAVPLVVLAQAPSAVLDRGPMAALAQVPSEALHTAVTHGAFPRAANPAWVAACAAAGCVAVVAGCEVVAAAMEVVATANPAQTGGMTGN